MQILSTALNNGVTIPMIGFGTWQLAGDVCQNSVMSAVKAGYPGIDTAKAYDNETFVGRAVRDCGVPREQLFITTKLWNSDHGYDAALRAFDASMERLGLDFLDLYLIHWPGFDLYTESWKALEKLYKDGRVRAIGVSNFLVSHLERLATECEILPAVNQIEAHPYLVQRETEAYCKAHGILVEAWSPLMSGKTALGDEVVLAVAKAHGKTPAQVILRWHIEEGRRVIPRSTNAGRIAENLDIFDFSLTDKEIAAIGALASNNVRTGPHPDTFFLSGR